MNPKLYRWHHCASSDGEVSGGSTSPQDIHSIPLTQAVPWIPPSNYANITQIDSAVVTVGAGGSFNVLPHVGS